MDATHQLVCARLGDSASTALKLFLFSLCSTLLMSTKSKPQTPHLPGTISIWSGLSVLALRPRYRIPTLR